MLAKKNANPGWVIFTLYLTGVLWSFSGVLIKWTNCNAFAIAGSRAAVAVLVQVLYLLYRGERYKSPRTWVGWLGAVMFSANTIFLVFAFQLTSTANAVFLHYSGMALAAFLAPRLLKERTSKQDWLAIGLVILGVSRLTGTNLVGSRAGAGDLLGVLCAVTLAVEVICFRKLAKVEKEQETTNQGLVDQKSSRYDLLRALITSDLLTLCASSLMVIFVYPDNVNIRQSWWQLIALGIVPWALPNILYCYVVKEVQSVIKAMIAWSLEPVFTVIWPMLVMSEYPTAQGYLGCFLILLALVMQRSGQLKSQAEPSAQTG